MARSSVNTPINGFPFFALFARTGVGKKQILGSPHDVALAIMAHPMVVPQGGRKMPKHQLDDRTSALGTRIEIEGGLKTDQFKLHQGVGRNDPRITIRCDYLYACTYTHQWGSLLLLQVPSTILVFPLRDHRMACTISLQ